MNELRPIGMVFEIVYLPTLFEFQYMTWGARYKHTTYRVKAHVQTDDGWAEVLEPLAVKYVPARLVTFSQHGGYTFEPISEAEVASGWITIARAEHE